MPVQPLRFSLSAPDATRTVSEALVDALVGLGVQHAFGIFGGGIAPFCQAVSDSPIRLLHCRHEAGAAFAAIESSLATGRPTVVIATTGPGVSNLYTGMAAARAEGAKVLFISGTTSSPQRGRGAFQETGGAFSMLSPLFVAGNLFHLAGVIDDPSELETTLSRLASGFARPQGFVAHLGLPLAIQTARRGTSLPRVMTVAPGSCDPRVSVECAELLANEQFVIWAGFGSRAAGELVQTLAERSGAAVMCTPRAKGVMPETHPLYLGVTGLGGHARVSEYLRRKRPTRALVLGSRLGEMSSFWLPELAPREGFIHVDLEAEAFGTAYPDVPTLGIQAEIGAFLRDLLRAWPERPKTQATSVPAPGPLAPPLTPAEGAVRPSYLMQQIQHEVIDRSEAIVMTEAGNSFSLGSQKLHFPESGRYRVSSGFGSMGHATAGVLGAALARGNKAFAIVGDGAMLMLNEINTAANYGIGAVWVVLNDARYGMIEQGMRSVGWKPFETDFPRADFVAIARAMGADGIRVEREQDVAAALQMGLAALGPFVIDVLIDPTEIAPAGQRNQSLSKQGLSTAPGGLPDFSLFPGAHS
ncbi:MAG TPA: thiamine pyrophosphate-binding protein [Polyangiaceae bacterium]|nr:thiamine pyrophosphate-binding protein [Polyangiaceae bacterium]